MGFFTDLFGSEGDREYLFSQAFDQASGDLLTGYGEFQDYLSQAYDMMMGDMGGDRFRSDYQAGITQLEGALDSARSFMQSSFASQREYLEQGYDASKDQTSAAFDQAMQRTSQRNAFTGMGNTSFGASMLTAIDQQEGNALGLIDERRNENLAALMGQQAAMNSQFELNAGGALMNAQAGLASGSFNTTTAAAGLLQSIGQAGLNTYGQIAQFRYGTGENQAANVGSGFNLGGALIGMAGGAISSMIAPGVGTPVQ